MPVTVRQGRAPYVSGNNFSLNRQWHPVYSQHLLRVSETVDLMLLPRKGENRLTSFLNEDKLSEADGHKQYDDCYL